jgi:hypothetical protein
VLSTIAFKALSATSDFVRRSGVNQKMVQE